MKKTYKNTNWRILKLNFDDEQIADEKSIANMKLKFAGLKKDMAVSALSEPKSLHDFDMLSLGQCIKKTDKLFSYLQEITSGELKVFVDELKEVNLLELKKLQCEYAQLKDIDVQNPELIKKPNSAHLLNLEITKNEIGVLKKLFGVFSLEKKDETKQVLRQMIQRRLDAVENIFL